jgi:predicted SAM-dependent methyltransferase
MYANYLSSSIGNNMKQLLKKVPIVKNIAHNTLSYVRRKQGINSLLKQDHSRPLRLVIGSAGFFETGWIGTDIEYLSLLNPRHWETFFRKNSIDAILAEHVWEHLTISEGLEAATRCFEYLKPGGYLRVAVPDGFHPDHNYIEHVKPGGIGDGADDHKVLYNYKSFADIFEQAGFRAVLLEYFDTEGHFHCADWDPQDGKIYRSKRFDQRNQEGKLNYTSLILDAHKNAK